MCVYVVKINHMLAVGGFFIEDKLEHTIVFENELLFLLRSE